MEENKEIKPSLKLFKTNIGIAINDLKQNSCINGCSEPERRLKSLEEFSNISIQHQRVFYKRMREYKTMMNEKYYPNNN